MGNPSLTTKPPIQSTNQRQLIDRSRPTSVDQKAKSVRPSWDLRAGRDRLRTRNLPEIRLQGSVSQKPQRNGVGGKPSGYGGGGFHVFFFALFIIVSFPLIGGQPGGLEGRFFSKASNPQTNPHHQTTTKNGRCWPLAIKTRLRLWEKHLPCGDCPRGDSSGKNSVLAIGKNTKRPEKWKVTGPTKQQNPKP